MNDRYFNQTMESVVKALCLKNSISVFWEEQGTTPYALVSKREIHIPIICCTETLEETEMENVRASCFHELAHILYTQEVDIKGNLHTVWNGIEDVWIEDRIGREYIGIGKSLSNSNHDIVNKLFEEDKKDRESWEKALLSLMSTEMGIPVKWTLDEETQALFDAAKPIFHRWKESKTSLDNLALAEQIFNLWKDKMSQKSSKNKVSTKHSEETDKQEWKSRKNIPDNLTEKRNQNISVSLSNLNNNGGIYTAYRDEDYYDVVCPLPFMKSAFQEILKSLGKPLNSLISKIQEKMEASILNSIETGKEEGALNPHMLPQIAFGLRKDVFQETCEGFDLNTAVSVCVDASYSMNKISESVKKTLVVLGETLSRIDVPFEIFSSSTFTPKASKKNYTRWRGMSFSIYKRFDDNWNRVGSTVTSFRGLENHIDGEDISYARSNLEARREKRKIIFVLTDGCPYSGQNNESNQKITQNLIRVVKKARKEGIEVYAISIDCGDGPSLLYGDNFTMKLKHDDGSLFSKDVLTAISNIVTKNVPSPR